MKVRVVNLAEAAYACIEAGDEKFDVRLFPGRSAAKSLREAAQALEDQAWRMMDRANRIREAALVLGNPPAPVRDPVRMEEYAAGFDAVLEEV